MLDAAVGLRTAGGLDRVAGACAIDQDAFLPVRGARLFEAGVDRGIVSHVDLAEHPADLARDFLALFGLQVEDGDFRTLGGERAGGRRAKARCASGDHCGGVAVDVHG